MTRTLAEMLNDLSLKGEKFENTQHSNRQGEVYEIQRVYNGLSEIMIDVKYHDGVTETVNINQMKDDIHEPTQSAQYQQQPKEATQEFLKALKGKPLAIDPLPSVPSPVDGCDGGGSFPSRRRAKIQT